MVLREEVPKDNEQQLGGLGILKGESEDRSKNEVTKVEQEQPHGKRSILLNPWIIGTNNN